MEVIFILIAISLLLGGFFLFLFIRSVNQGQFDDLESPAVRILSDENNQQINKSNDGIRTI